MLTGKPQPYYHIKTEARSGRTGRQRKRERLVRTRQAGRAAEAGTAREREGRPEPRPEPETEEPHGAGTGRAACPGAVDGGGDGARNEKRGRTHCPAP